MSLSKVRKGHISKLTVQFAFFVGRKRLMNGTKLMPEICWD
jgi:hypothetical protein